MTERMTEERLAEYDWLNDTGTKPEVVGNKFHHAYTLWQAMNAERKYATDYERIIANLEVKIAELEAERMLGIKYASRNLIIRGLAEDYRLKGFHTISETLLKALGDKV